MKYYPVRNFRVIRIRCKHDKCGMVLELPRERVAEVLKDTNACCPLCKKPFTLPNVEGGADVVTQLARAVKALDDLANNVEVSLPVPVQVNEAPD